MLSLYIMAKKTFTPIPPMAELPPAEEINVREILDSYLSGEIDLICVLGPTASGKTRYAVSLAREINRILAERRLGAEGAERTPPTPAAWAPSPAARGVARFADPLSSPPHRVLIAGLGGAGKAAAIAAASLGMDMILMNRDMSKAEAVAGIISTMPQAPEVEVRPLDDFRECFRSCDIIIYNIPTAIPAITMLEDNDFRGTVSEDGMPRPKSVLEANYKNPSFDNLLIDRMIKSNPNASYTQGQTWLLYQALTGYEIFTGQKPDLQSMSAVL